MSSSPPIITPSRTPTPTSTHPAPPAPEPTHAPPPGPPPSHHQPTPLDPKVSELQTMFPTVELSVITLILESVHGSQDRAIEQLLSITDPEFRPDELSSVRHEEESQLDLDAQFARSLQMEDEQAYRSQRSVVAGQDAYAPPPPTNHRSGSGELPYEPRTRRARPQGQGQEGYGALPGGQGWSTGQGQGNGYGYGDRDGNGGNPAGMLAMEDKLNQFAEVGKQTLTSLFSKAKAKYSEFQTQNTQLRNEPDRARESTWGERSQSQGLRNQLWRRPSEEGGVVPGGGRGGVGGRNGSGSAGSGGLWGEDQSSSTRSSSFSSASTIDPGPTPLSPHTAANPPLRQSPARWQPSDAYDDPILPTPPTKSSSTPLPVGGRVDLGTSPGRRSPGMGGVGSPEKGKIDAAKLGILPKKRVDLLSTSPPTNLKSNSSTNPILIPDLDSSTTTLKATSPPSGRIIFNPEDDADGNDFNPSLPSHRVGSPLKGRNIVAQIPKTPPVEERKGFVVGDGDDDDDDDLEYTKNPFDER